MTEKFFLFQRIHEVTLEDFFKHFVGVNEQSSLEDAQESMHSIIGSCVIVKGEIIDTNCIEDEE